MTADLTVTFFVL